MQGIIGYDIDSVVHEETRDFRPLLVVPDQYRDVTGLGIGCGQLVYRFQDMSGLFILVAEYGFDKSLLGIAGHDLLSLGILTAIYRGNGDLGTGAVKPVELRGGITEK